MIESQASPPEYKPTLIEQRMYAALDALGIDHKPQTPFGFYTVDTYLPMFGAALEADGCGYHGCYFCGGDLDESMMEEKRRKRRDEHLYRRWGVICLHVWGHNLKQDSDAINAIKTVLAPWLG